MVWEGAVWLLEDRPFPVRYVNLGFGGHFEIVNSKMVFDSKVPPEYFQPPSDVRFGSADIHRKTAPGNGETPPGGGAVVPLPEKPVR